MLPKFIFGVSPFAFLAAAAILIPSHLTDGLSLDQVVPVVDDGADIEGVVEGPSNRAALEVDDVAESSSVDAVKKASADAPADGNTLAYQRNRSGGSRGGGSRSGSSRGGSRGGSKARSGGGGSKKARSG